MGVSKLPIGLLDLDVGKRAAEAINLHLLADREANVGGWVAVRMADGSSDKTVYDTRERAISHQLDEFLCCYLQIPPGGADPKECAIFVAYCRHLYDRGYRLPDPVQVRSAMMQGLAVGERGRLLRALSLRRS